ncbi:glycosyltransferase [Candidatus Pacearchaeota archaeon]|nr:glycosyltransferase [Candidatus Pacearchaeota archaeon]
MANVSCIIPVYNCEKYIGKVIPEALDQCDEVIFVNDKTPDHSMEIVKKYKNNKKVKIFELDENKGLGYVRNFGAKKASYNLLLYLDSDQILEKNYVKKAKNALKDKVAYIGGVRPTEKKTHSQRFMHLMRFHESKGEKNPERMSDGVFLIKKKALKDAGGFYQHMRRGGTEKLFDGLKENDYKVKRINIKSLHLGSPDKFNKLLKRQWKYGKEQLFIEKRFDFKKTLQGILLMSPLSIFVSFLLYPTLLEENLHDDILFILLLPVYFYIFMFTYYLSYFITFFGLRGNYLKK